MAKTFSKRDLDEMVAAARARSAALLAHQKAQQQTTVVPQTPALQVLPVDTTNAHLHPSPWEIWPRLPVGFNPFMIDGKQLNTEQAQAVIRFGIKGESGCLIGPAGSGKTTVQKAIALTWEAMGLLTPLKTFSHKHLPTGMMNFWGGSFTRIATRNYRKNMPAQFKQNVCTLHALLEYEPVFYEIPDPETGKMRTTRIFEPSRHEQRPLPPELNRFVIDEGSMVSYEDLFGKLCNAISAEEWQLLVIGDIAQIPPIFDDAVLGYKMLDSVVVELVQVYRHAGPIIGLANHIRTGFTVPDMKHILQYQGRKMKDIPKKILAEAMAEWNKDEDGSKVTLHYWKQRLDGIEGPQDAVDQLGDFFTRQIDAGLYNPMIDMILMPYNKSCGTVAMNKKIAGYYDVKEERTVFEIVAGKFRTYNAVGDKIFYDRAEAVITKIEPNPIYTGRAPRPGSKFMTRDGYYRKGYKPLDDEKITAEPGDFSDIDALLSGTLAKDDERKNAASHRISVQLLEEDGKVNPESTVFTLSSAGDINSLLMGYALTVHKAQGSQWPKVYTVFHNSHNATLNRELLYTAITRAQRELFIIAEPETFVQAVQRQAIKGNTLADKAVFFQGKKRDKETKREFFASLNNMAAGLEDDE